MGWPKNRWESTNVQLQFGQCTGFHLRATAYSCQRLGFLLSLVPHKLRKRGCKRRIEVGPLSSRIQREIKPTVLKLNVHYRNLLVETKVCVRKPPEWYGDLKCPIRSPTKTLKRQEHGYPYNSALPRRQIVKWRLVIREDQECYMFQAKTACRQFVGNGNAEGHPSSGHDLHSRFHIPDGKPQALRF